MSCILLACKCIEVEYVTKYGASEGTRQEKIDYDIGGDRLLSVEARETR